MDQTITFAAVPLWTDVRDLLARSGLVVQMRMIDGQLAFPDEEPPQTWRELRVAVAEGGMVTVRREAEGVRCVTWGNADAAARHAWNALAWALAEAGSGQVQTPKGVMDAATYRRWAELPDGLRSSGDG
jgi:hypothetical protein